MLLDANILETGHLGRARCLKPPQFLKAFLFSLLRNIVLDQLEILTNINILVDLILQPLSSNRNRQSRKKPTKQTGKY